LVAPSRRYKLVELTTVVGRNKESFRMITTTTFGRAPVALVTWLTGTLGACAAMAVGSDFSVLTDFKPFRTYSWAPRDALPTGDPRLDNNPFFDARVRTAVDSLMAVKGYRVTHPDSAPGLTLHYHVSLRQRVDYVQADTDRGYTYPSSETIARSYEEGTLVIDIAEARTKRILWRGWAQRDITGVIDDRKQLERRTYEAVHEILRLFPPGQ
jgi:hypothetical protein